jgi:hypothetical protein
MTEYHSFMQQTIDIRISKFWWPLIVSSSSKSNQDLKEEEVIQSTLVNLPLWEKTFPLIFGNRHK